METPRTPVDVRLPDDLPPPEWTIGELRSPTWDPPTRSRRSAAPLIGVAVLALGAAAAAGLYLQRERAPQATVTAQAGEHVTLPLPSASTTPPVTELPATPQASAATPPVGEKTPADATSGRAAPPPRKDEQSADAGPSSRRSTRVAEAALKPLPLPKAPEPVESAGPAPTPPAAPPVDTPPAEPPPPSTQQ